MAVAGVGYASSSIVYYGVKTQKTNSQTEDTAYALYAQYLFGNDSVEDENDSSDITNDTDAANTIQTVSGSSLFDRLNGNKTAPYSMLADKNGIIDYNGVSFVCDYENNRLCLGDVSNPKNCLNIPLSNGGSLIVNRDNLADLAKAIGMFSPEDINRIMRAIARDNKVQEMQKEIDDDTNSLGDSTDKLLDKVENVDKEAITNEEESRVTDLISESTICSYPAENAEENTWYITCYTEQGITCRGGRIGKMKDQWSIDFTDAGQYQKVLDFLDKFDKNDILTFANHENFWNDFLKGDIDEDTFVNVYDGIKNEILNYSEREGDSTFFDKDKMQYEQYINPLENHMMSIKEIQEKMDVLIQENQRHLQEI